MILVTLDGTELYLHKIERRYFPEIDKLPLHAPATSPTSTSETMLPKLMEG